MYADSVETTDEKDKRSQKARELYHYLNNNKDCYRIKSRDGRYQNQEKESYTKIWVCGISKLHGHHHENETQQDEMVCE